MNTYFKGRELKFHNQREESLIRIINNYIDSARKCYENEQTYVAEFYRTELNGMLTACFYLGMTSEPIDTYEKEDLI